jgi:hypothetical protein
MYGKPAFLSIGYKYRENVTQNGDRKYVVRTKITQGLCGTTLVILTFA